jgi:TRAP-type C4-dicarboxylate transport system substrate-binding protein
MQESCNQARDYERAYNRALDPKLLDQIKAKGATYTEIPAAERARMREMLKPVYDKYARNLGEDVVRQTLAELDKHRAAAR